MSTKEIESLFESKWSEIFQNDNLPKSLYEPANYISLLKGKRLRPLLCLLSYQAFCDHPLENCIPIAQAIEIFHNFTLVHDDIMDNADFRRKLPTVHNKWNLNTAILSGDVLFAIAYQRLCNTKVKNINELFTFFTNIAIEVCEGQALDLDFSKNSIISYDEYISIIEKKTAALIRGSIVLGGLAAEIPKEHLEIISHWGNIIGLFFQIQDDYLDLYADENKFGKKIGGDILEDKCTILWTLALKNADYQQSELLLKIRTEETNPERKINRTKEIFDELNLKSETNSLIMKYQNDANEIIQPLKSYYSFAELDEYISFISKRNQ